MAWDACAGGWFQFPPLPSLTEAVIACNEALLANPCPSVVGELLALQERMQQLREIRGISVAQLHSLRSSCIPGVGPKPSCLMLLSPKGTLGLEGCHAMGCSPHGWARYSCWRIGCICFPLWEAEWWLPAEFLQFEEGAGSLAHWAGGGMLEGWVMAQLGCPHTAYCCLGQLPLQDQFLPHYHDLSPCPETSVHPAGLPIPPKNSWHQHLREPRLPGLCWYGWERSPPSSSSPGSAASTAHWVLPLALS